MLDRRRVIGDTGHEGDVGVGIGHTDGEIVNDFDRAFAGHAGVGIDKLAPAEGAFYVYADVSHLTTDSQLLSKQWLDELGIATTPGIDFDPYEGHRYLRFSFCGATADMHRCIELLAERYG